ncbi:SGNH hydrolase domain-containing protein, partial [Acinetobacter baumannii]
IAAEKRAAEEVGVPLLDLNDYICSDEWCLPIAGNVFIYRDSHHLTATFSTALANVLGRHLEQELHAGRSVVASSPLACGLNSHDEACLKAIKDNSEKMGRP